MLRPRHRAVFEALLPGQAHPLLRLGVLDTGFEGFYDDFARSAPRTLRWGLRASLAAAAWLAPALIGRLPPITRLEPEARERALKALGGSRSYPLRQTLLLLKMAAALCYGADRRVRDAVGYPGQPDAPGPAPGAAP